MRSPSRRSADTFCPENDLLIKPIFWKIQIVNSAKFSNVQLTAVVKTELTDMWWSALQRFRSCWRLGEGWQTAAEMGLIAPGVAASSDAQAVSCYWA